MKKETKFSLWYYLLAVIGLLMLKYIFFSGTGSHQELSYAMFREAIKNGSIQKVVVLKDRFIGKIYNETTSANLQNSPAIFPESSASDTDAKTVRQFTVNRLPGLNDTELLALFDSHQVDYSGKIEKSYFQNFFLNWALPFFIMIALWGFLFRRMHSTGSRVLNLGRSKAAIHAETPENRVTFRDAAGVNEAVQEVEEVVEFLSSPQKFTKLGGKLPRGVLLVGPPGTGKTLLARAVAGEARVPFFSMSGSDFVEMFVGVGASRVRDLFQEAKGKAPCIIFIDEIDAIGKSRARSGTPGNSHDERENTLNQLLVEMDGFDPGIGVIMMGATNRPDVLDPALLRPGRFDRQVLVDKPDINGRIEIFKVHTQFLKLADNVVLKRLAAQTPGFVGADIANICNEAALLAARKGSHHIVMQSFEEAIERIITGLEKKNKLITEKERRIVAYHESGHAIVGYFTPGADPIQKVSIIPRGYGALGYTLQMPLEDRYLMTRSELLGKIKGLLGGRAAEEIIFNEISTGASNDLERVAQLARNMITVYGMSKRLPNLSLVQKNSPDFLGQANNLGRRSEKIEQLIDDEVTEMINLCYENTKKLLKSTRHLLDRMAAALLEKEVLNFDEIREILSNPSN